MTKLNAKPKRTQSGLTLVELLVASLLGTIASAMSISLFINLHFNSQAQLVRAEHESNSRAIERFLNWHIAKAGYSTDYNEGLTKDEQFNLDGTTFLKGAVVKGADFTPSAGLGAGTPESISYRYRGHGNPASGMIIDCSGNPVADTSVVIERIYVNSNKELLCETSGSSVIVATNVDFLGFKYGVRNNTGATLNQVESYKNAQAVTAAEWADVVAVRALLVHHSERNLFATNQANYEFSDFEGSTSILLTEPRQYRTKHIVAINLLNMMK